MVRGHLQRGQRRRAATPTSARPPLRSMIEPAASTLSARRAAALRLRPAVLPPVVITSSTTTAVSPGCNVKPRRSRHFSCLRIALGEQESGAERARHFVADDQAAQGRRNHQVDSSRRILRNSSASMPAELLCGVPGAASTSAHCRYSGAVQPAGEPEMALQVGAGGTEQLQDVSACGVTGPIIQADITGFTCSGRMRPITLKLRKR